jgi:hypothetical protein
MTEQNAKTAAARRTSSRLKGILILGVVVLSGLVFLAWSQPWGSLSVKSSNGVATTISVAGSVAAPALSALGLAGLALAAALAIAGRIIRVVLGALQAVLGISIFLSGLGPLIDPVAAGSPTVTLATGVAGIESVRKIATDAGQTPWGFLALALGVLVTLSGIVIAVTTTRWPDAGRKYQAVRFQAADGRSSDNPADLVGSDMDQDDEAGADDPTDAEETDIDAAEGEPGDESRTETDAATSRAKAVDNWDSLSQGRDPTA